MKIKEITTHLEEIAPLYLQESYDNCGLLTGQHEWKVEGVLITLDCTEEVVQEAIDTKCNLIIAHHPIIFSGLKKLNGYNYIEKTIIKAIKHDIAIYAWHTNLDSISTGVNSKICELIGIKNPKILQPKSDTIRKIITFVPEAASKSVLNALHEAGAGKIGNYSNCSFQSTGIGTFQPEMGANPVIGKSGNVEQVGEVRLELIYPTHLERQILSALKTAHPYEEVAYHLQELVNEDESIGAGMIGELDIPLSEQDFLAHLKKSMNLTSIKYTKTGEMVKKVAVCGGSGRFLLNAAKKHRADAFITSDFKYHEYFDGENQLIIADIGHYESEIFTKELINDILNKKFTTFAVRLSEIVTNPISYY